MAAGSPRSGRQQADRELRIAVAIAIPVLILGQVLIFTGWRWVALGVIGLPGTFVALLLARRWTEMARR